MALDPEDAAPAASYAPGPHPADDEEPVVPPAPLRERAPGTATPAPDPLRPDPPPPASARDALPASWLAAGQLCAGSVACCLGASVAVPLGFAFVSALGINGVLATLVTNSGCAAITGTAAGGAVTWFGDAWGDKRAPALWPILASGGAIIAGTLLGVLFEAVVGPAAITSREWEADTDRALREKGPRFALQFAALGVILAGAVVTPVVVYSLTATPKLPGDTGQGLPGLLTPASPAQPPAGSPVARPAPIAMRF